MAFKDRHGKHANNLKLAIFVLCLIAPWSLLWLDSSLIFPYATAKAWLFRSIVALAFALLLIYLLLYKEQDTNAESRATPARLWIYSLLAFLLWTGISNLFGIDLYRSFWSNYERMSGYLAYLHWSMYLLCLMFVLNVQRVRFLLINLITIITVVSATGLLGSEDRIISSLGNPIYLGNLNVFGIFICGFLFVGGHGKIVWHKVVYATLSLGVIALLLTSLIQTASRGPMLALVVGCMVLLAWLVLHQFKKYPRAIVVSAAGVLLLIAVLGMSLQLNFAQILRDSDHYALQRIGRISLNDQTTKDRLENWSIALDAASDHPWSGWGQDNYMIAFHEHYRAGVMDYAQVWFDRAHNAYLDVLVASGWPGLILYGLMLLLPIFLVMRYSTWGVAEQAFALGLLSAFLVKNIVGFDTFSSTLVWISFVAVIWASLRPLVQYNVQRRETVNAWMLGSLCMLLAASAVYYLNILPSRENRLFASLISQRNVLNSEALSAVLSLPAEDLRYGQNAKLAVFDRLLRALSNKPLDVQGQRRRKQLSQQAEKLVSEELRHQPRNARIRHNGAVLLTYSGQYEQSIQLAKPLLVSAPQRTVIWHLLAQLYTAAGQHDAARTARAQQKFLNPKWKPE